MTTDQQSAPPRGRGRPRAVRAAPRKAMAGRLVRAWRDRLGFSKTDAALKLGLSRNAIIKYENGASEIPDHVALACAALAYGLPRPD